MHMCTCVAATPELHCGRTESVDMYAWPPSTHSCNCVLHLATPHGVQVWFPSREALAHNVHFQVDVSTAGETVTHKLSLPPNEDIPATGIARVLDTAAVLDQSMPKVGVAAGLEGATFAVTIGFPSRVLSHSYIPTVVSAALFEFNASTGSGGAVRERFKFSDATEPQQVAQQWNWTSAAAPVRISSWCCNVTSEGCCLTIQKHVPDVLFGLSALGNAQQPREHTGCLGLAN
jgi:hypothetical protein